MGCFTVVTLMVLFKMLLFTASWALANVLGVVLSIIVLVCFMSVYSSFVSFGSAVYHSWVVLLVTPAFYLSLSLVLVVTLVPDLAWQAHRRHAHPGLKHIVAEQLAGHGGESATAQAASSSVASSSTSGTHAAA